MNMARGYRFRSRTAVDFVTNESPKMDPDPIISPRSLDAFNLNP